MPADQLTVPGDWRQVVVEFADRQTAERVAAMHLRPELAAAEADDSMTAWFFTRKSPCWRLRYATECRCVQEQLARFLDRLAAEGRTAGWTAGIYEPEVFAFGGVAAMDVAHELFHQDSRGILDYLARTEVGAPGPPGLGRRELTILLCSLLLRSAGLDWFEQGDVWARVLQHRSAAPTTIQTPRRGDLHTAMYRLMTLDAGPGGGLLDGGPLAAMSAWSAAFERAGRQLADLTRSGALERGLRAVLTHHVIFHWNRLGLSAAEQRTLAALAKEVVMTEPNTSRYRTCVDAAVHLRNALVEQLREQGTLRTDRVEAALRAVPRHLFVPTVPLEEAYADDPVYTKHDGSGASISAASQPSVVVTMLEQLQAMPRERILEIGAGTGYNAALLAHLVGEGGHVTTIDVDEDIVEGARSGLAAAGVLNVSVVLGDGALGHADGAPYDRIIAAVGAWDLPRAWLDQLAPNGRLVVPLRLRGSVSRSIVFEREDDHWRSRSSSMCTFMPLRGIADDARRTIALAPDAAVCLKTHQEQAVDAAALAGVLEHPATEVWTGVLFGPLQSFEWLDLWLACAMDRGLSRMPVQRSAIESGLVRPQFGWGAMAVTDGGSLAYLTLRPAEEDGVADGTDGRRYEVGVIGHGPSGGELAGRVALQIRSWDRDFRSRTVRIEIQPAGAGTRLSGQFNFDAPHNRLAISWE